MASNEFDKTASRFRVHQPSGLCKTPTTIPLLQLSLWVSPAVCSLICGSSIFRRRLSGVKKQPAEHAEITNRFFLFVSLFGSFFLQAVLSNVLQAQLLNDDNPDNTISNLYWIWLIRPLPATFVLFMAYICPTLYLENALEMQCVEGLTGMLTIGIYDDLRKVVEGVVDLSTEEVGDKSLRAGLKHISEGADLGLAFWILSLLVALATSGLVIGGMLREKPIDSTPLRLWTGWSIVFNMVRTASGFLIWTGIVTVDDLLFCPNLAATGGIAAISFASTLVDHSWRAFFHVEGAIRLTSLGSIFRAPLLRSYRKAPTDEETSRDETQGGSTRRSSMSYSIRSTFMQHSEE